MSRRPTPRSRTLVTATLLLAAAAPAFAAAADLTTEQARVLKWRDERVAALTSDSGWLTLAGLFWLNEGDNSFGSAAGNDLVLNNAALAHTAGTFQVDGGSVRFRAQPDGGVTLDGQPADSINLKTDAGGEPTVLASGPLRFFVIERGGRLAVRVRDLNSPRRLQFRGLQYFPISTRWVISARFEPYPPGKRIRIVNILGMEQDQECPGAVVFTKNGRDYRLDTVRESPEDPELLIMFADGTSGQATYGAGRFMDIPMPAGGAALLDFNKAYNPPCALNDFATCPLPPPQNRLKLRIEAGELKYAGGPVHSLP